MLNLGNRAEDSVLDFKWNSNAIAGESITRATNGTISVYKGNNTTQSTAGVTDTEDFDSLTGVHHVHIDLSADAFYATGEDYQVVLSGATIDGKSINAAIACFTIEKGFDEVDVVKFGGVAGTFASGIPEVKAASLGATAKADVNAEVDTALVDIHLDHLLAVTYDPASKPGAADALLNELIESDGGVSRFTANALEQAPSGGGATDPWDVDLPGAYAAGKAGYIVGTNLNATVASRLASAGYTAPDNAGIGVAAAAAAAAATDASTAATNSTSILGKIGAFTGAGINTIFGFFTALMRKDATAPSDLGGTYDPTTDAVERLAELSGDIYTGHITAELYHEDEDRYAVVWKKSGVAVSADITVPKIMVVKWSDGTPLIASSTDMTQVGTSQTFKYAETDPDARVGNHELALVICSATIDGATRTDKLYIRKPVAS